MRIAPLLAALALAATALPAAAATPKPTASSAVMGAHKVPLTSLHNSRPNAKPHAMSGQGCNSGPTSVRAQNVTNPITGKAQAAPIISIPISKGGGSVATSTNRAQQTQACAHTH